MKNGGAFRILLKELSRDPQLKQIMAKARRQTRGKGGAKVENVTGMFLLMLAIASRFTKRKKARALDELIDVISLLVQVSLLLKENIFDRPEVREFFSQSYKQIYSLAQEFVAMVLPQTKPVRGMRTPRRA